MFVSNLKYKNISELIIHMLNLVEEEEAGEALNLNIALIPSAHNWEKEANYQYYLIIIIIILVITEISDH